MTLEYIEARYKQYLALSSDPARRPIAIDSLFRAADSAQVMPQALHRKWTHGQPISGISVLAIAAKVAKHLENLKSSEV